MKTLHKIHWFCQHNLKHWVEAAVYIIEGKFFPALQSLCRLKWNAWLTSCLWLIKIHFLKLCVQMNDAEITQNTTFVLILIYIYWQSKWNTLPVCRKLVMLYLLLLRLKVLLHIQLLKTKSKYSHGICHFNPRKMVCLRFFTVRHWNAELSPRLSTNA